MSTAIFKITDGTNSVDLLELREGVAVQGWQQAVATYKGGGTFQQSSLSDGRRLVDKHFDAIQESIPVPNIAGGTQDITISILHELFALMENASDYWAGDWCDSPVWLESRAECETNTRYALVVTAFIPNIADIYAPSAFVTGEAPLADMMLIIEREHWTENAPGTGTATELSAVETYDGRNLGNVDSSGVRDPATSGVYVANKRNTANITDIYTWSAANGFSANLMDAALPYNLIDDVGVAPQVGDLVYFGIDDTLANSGPFCSLIFDIGTAQAGLTMVWENWNGAAWVALTAGNDIQDNTNTGGQPLDTTGVNSVVVNNTRTNLGTVIINGITGRWIRLRITAVGVVTAPTQQNRDVYSVIWPYTEIQADEIGGNLDAMTLIKLSPQSDQGDILVQGDFRRAVVGLRSLSRGSNFTAYLNCADEQNPTNVAVAITGAFTSFVSLALGGPGREIKFDTLGAASALASRFTITISSPLTAEYYGQYRMLLRALFSGAGGGTFTIQVVTTVSSGGSAVNSPQSLITSGRIAIDMGVISLPLSSLSTSEIVDQIEFDVQIGYDGGGSDALYSVDLILIPVDEWACDTLDYVLSSDSHIERGERLHIDSIGYPKANIRTYAEDVSSSVIRTIWLPIKNGPAVLHNNSPQRLWFAFFDIVSGVSEWDPEPMMLVEIERQQRYLGPRGSQ